MEAAEMVQQPKMAPAVNAPIEAKVKALVAGGLPVGLVSALLVAYVPAFHSGLPPVVVALLPFVLALVSSTAAAWLAPHTVRGTDPPVTAVPPV
jgi:hypothetical protein